VVSPRPEMSRPTAVLIRGRAAGGPWPVGHGKRDRLRRPAAGLVGVVLAPAVCSSAPGAGLVWWVLACPSGRWCAGCGR
jgi:hypothetical protein